MRCDFSLETCRDRVTAKGKRLRESWRGHAQPLAAVAGKRRFACSDVWLSQRGAEGLNKVSSLSVPLRTFLTTRLIGLCYRQPIVLYFLLLAVLASLALAKRILIMFPQTPNPRSPNASRLIQPGRVTFQRYTGKQRMISGRCNNVSLHKLIAERLACAILMSMSNVKL